MVGIDSSIDPKSCLTSSTRSFEFGSTSSMRRCIDMAYDTEQNSKERVELVNQLLDRWTYLCQPSYMIASTIDKSMLREVFLLHLCI
jgi:hypothetical protein